VVAAIWGLLAAEGGEAAEEVAEIVHSAPNLLKW
jgi:hypothetical protein